MNGIPRMLLVAALSLGLLLLLLLLVALGNLFEAQRPETLAFREVVLATPPPPPPPPPRDRSDASAAPVNLSAPNPESPVQMLNLELQVDLPKGQLLTSGTGAWSDGSGIGLEIDWSGFSLAELDGYPVVMQAPMVDYPRVLAERGINEYAARLHILIDETGQAYLISILETPDTRIAGYLENFVKGVRFTPPTIAGVPVKAEFAWPVAFKTP